MNGQHNNRQQLVLNAIPLGFDRQAPLRVGRLPFEGRDELNALRDRLAVSYSSKLIGWVEVGGPKESGR